MQGTHKNNLTKCIEEQARGNNILFSDSKGVVTERLQVTSRLLSKLSKHHFQQSFIMLALQKKKYQNNE